MAAILADKRLEVLKENVRKVSHVAVLPFWHPKAPGSRPQWEESQNQRTIWDWNFILWKPVISTGMSLHSKNC